MTNRSQNSFDVSYSLLRDMRIHLICDGDFEERFPGFNTFVVDKYLHNSD